MLNDCIVMAEAGDVSMVTAISLMDGNSLKLVGSVSRGTRAIKRLKLSEPTSEFCLIVRFNIETSGLKVRSDFFCCLIFQWHVINKIYYPLGVLLKPQ